MIQAMLLAGDGNILVNPSFLSSDNWTLGVGWSISGGAAHSTGAGSLGQNLIAQGPGSYEVTIVISGFSGTGLFVALGSTNGTPIGSSGTFKQTIVSPSGFSGITVNPATGSESFAVENIIIRRI